MKHSPGYEAFTAETLPRRLVGVADVTGRLGPGPWRLREVGDGYLNLVSSWKATRVRWW